MCLRDVLSELGLDDVEEIVWQPYHKDGAGRPPRSPLGILKALIVKRLRGIPSDRELYRRLWRDPELRDVCDIEDYEKPYHPSQLCRFRERVGSERLEKVMDNLIGKLVDARVVKGEIVACDATFIKAYSKREPRDDSRGYSDPEARVGRAGKTYMLGYKVHLSADSESELPIAFVVAPANENEKRHAPKLMAKTVKTVKGPAKVFVADSQYSSQKLRKKIAYHGTKPIIPYPANQNPGEKDFLRIDKQFKTHGNERVKSLYKHRASVERTISRLKQHLSLENHKVRGLRNIAIHVLLCIIAMLLIALTARKLKKPKNIRAITKLT